VCHETRQFLFKFTFGSKLMQGSGYDRESGMKWPIQRLRIYLQSMYGTKATIKLFHGIQEIVIKSLQAVQQAVTQDKHCFELYGYDVLVDENLTPWLIEVFLTCLRLNSCSKPTMHCACCCHVRFCTTCFLLASVLATTVSLLCPLSVSSVGFLLFPYLSFSFSASLSM
jgi:hypothetical protein